MLTLTVERSIEADPAAVWRCWKPTLAVRPREEESRNRDLYPLAYGIKIPITLVAVDDMRCWTLEHSLPRGRLRIEHWLEAAGGEVRVGQTYRVHGPLTLVYRLLAQGIRATAEDALGQLARRVRT